MKTVKSKAHAYYQAHPMVPVYETDSRGRVRTRRYDRPTHQKLWGLVLQAYDSVVGLHPQRTVQSRLDAHLERKAEERAEVARHLEDELAQAALASSMAEPELLPEDGFVVDHEADEARRRESVDV